MASTQDRLFLLQKQYGNLLRLANQVATTQPVASQQLRAQARELLVEIERLRGDLRRREGPGAIERAAVAAQDLPRDILVGAGRVVGETAQSVLTPVLAGAKPLLLPLGIALGLLLFLKSGGSRRKF